MVGFQEASMFGEAGCENSGKSDPGGSAGANPQCPQCGSTKNWRDGVRYSIFGDSIQRWPCRQCGLRFSDPEDVKKSWCNIERFTRSREKSLKTQTSILTSRQICALEAKNLEQEQVTIQVPGMNRDSKGMLVQYEAKMFLEGYGAETIRGAVSCLRSLITRNADLNDPESVKPALAKEEKKEKHWSQNRRRNVISAYTLFLKFQGRSWIKPKCTVDSKFPFIPTETEIDALIAGTHKKLSVYLQLLKETAMRCGEAHRLEWVNIDRENLVITLNKPEKHSLPRMFKVSEQLIETLCNLPKNSELIFPVSSKGMKVTFSKARKRLAQKLNNPRLLEIHFHTLRHWKATMLYHYTHDILTVADFLGHKDIENTRLYISLEKNLFKNIPDDKFIIRAVATEEEAIALGEIGFEPFMVIQGRQLMRKRK